MNKLSIFSISILILSSCLQRQVPDAKYNVNCPVRSIDVTCSKGEFNHTLHFNRAGKLVLGEYRNEDGSFRFRNEYELDSLGRVSGMHVVNASGQTESIYSYEYDGDFVSECILLGMNNEHVHCWYHINDGEHIVRSEITNEDTPAFVVTRSYDGDMCRETTLDAENGDTLGVSSIASLPDGRIVSVHSDNMAVSVEYDQSGLPISSMNTSLDSEGNIIWDKDLAKSPVRSFRYDFDRRGNWITRKEYSHSDSIEVAVIRREIRY